MQSQTINQTTPRGPARFSSVAGLAARGLSRRELLVVSGVLFGLTTYLTTLLVLLA